MPNFFAVQEATIGGAKGLLMIRVADPASAAVPADHLVYLDTDPGAGWTVQPLPPIFAKVTSPGITTKLAYFKAYA